LKRSFTIAHEIGLTRWWKDLSVSKKLYGVVGLLALLIAMEMGTLAFTMNILSAARAYVGGEGLWSKAQKDAVFEMQNYVATRNPKFYRAYLDQLKVPLGDRQARLEMSKVDMNPKVVTEGFLNGKIHAHDIPSMINLMRRFHDVKYLATVIGVWNQADDMLDQLIKVGDQIHTQIAVKGKASNSYEIRQLMNQLDRINSGLTGLEDQFSYKFGEASRWLEDILLIILLVTVLIVESTGLFLTVRFTRGLTRALSEVNTAAVEVSQGKFTTTVPVRSRDELGQLAEALNKMTESLRTSKGEQAHAEEASQIKNLFLANMSHEIRTPLSAILGFVELLKDPHVSEAERLQFLEIVERTGNSLATVLNDILDISKVEAGKLEVNRVTCQLPKLLADLQLLLQLRCESKGIYLQFKPVGYVPEWIYTDPMRLRQILLNMIGNAIKFTYRGGVAVSYSATQDSLEFSIVDTGIGIPAESMNKLFVPFSQGDLSIRKVHGGTGLGLSLSRRLAQLLGGDIVLDSSKVNVGSSFRVKVALDQAKASTSNLSEISSRASAVTGDMKLDKKRILLVDDSTDIQLLIRLFLSKSGANVDIASNGLEGVNRALEEKFDVVIMDMQMPVMDGYTATEKLRQKGYLSPIIGLTAHAMREDLAKCMQVGCNDVLTKPVNRGQLIDFVQKYC